MKHHKKLRKGKDKYKFFISYTSKEKNNDIISDKKFA